MNIGFEAKRAFLNDTGLGHYSRTLITSLAQYYPQHHYFAFTPAQTAMFKTDEFENINVCTPKSLLHKTFKSAWRSSWVTQDIKKLGIDLYHGLSHEIPVGIQQTGIPSVVTIHDLIHERFPEQYKPIDRKIYTKKFRYACEHATKIIAISNQTRQDIIDFYHTDPSKIEVCYQSCNNAYAEVQSSEKKEEVKVKYGLPDQFLLYVGSLIERKNLLNICKAIHQLKSSINLPLVVIGKGGAYRQKVQAFIKEAGIEQQIIFLSYGKDGKTRFIDADDFPAIYQSSSMLIYPSFFEGFGIPVLEGLWSKIPVITSNLSCLPEAGGDGAVYVNPASQSEIAEAIMRILEQPTFAAAQVQKGWEYAQLFTNAKCAESVMEVYSKALK